MPDDASELQWPGHACLPSPATLCTLALSRRLDICAFDLAARLGCLYQASHYGHPAWIITDRARQCAEARRLDGAMWEGGKKSLALPGSRKNSPIGLVTRNPWLDELKTIVLVEGGPDYFAALSLAIDSEINFRVATMLGASTSLKIDPGAFTGHSWATLKGANVLIIPHNDQAGVIAAGRWSTELYQLGAAKVKIQRLPEAFKDLNDFVSASPQAAQGLLQCLQ